MDLFGRIKVIGETTTYGESGFRKREIVITTDEQYPQTILIEFTQDKCDLLNSFTIGQPVKVAFNVRGREWVNPQGETKYFNQIQGWRIELLAAAGAPVQQGYQGPGSAADAYHNNQTNTNPQAGSNNSEEEHDDLPF